MEIAEDATRELIGDVLEIFGHEAHYEDWDAANGMYVVTERKYPEYAVEFIRKRFMELSFSMLTEMAVANSVNPAAKEGVLREAEIVERRIHQDRAIGNLLALKELCNFTVSLFPLQMRRFGHYDNILSEIAGKMRGWKRYIPGVKRRKESDDIE